MWVDRLRRAICGARDLDKTFAFVHWAYSRDQTTTPTRNQATPPVLNGGKPLLNSDYGWYYALLSISLLPFLPPSLPPLSLLSPIL